MSEPIGDFGIQHGGVVEELVFGTREGEAIAERVGEFCAARLGSEPSSVLFTATSVGVVFGLELGDGRRVVLKAHQPRESRATLEAVRDVQATLHRAGFPCPQPLAGPASLGAGQAVVEQFVDAGEFRDTHDPTCRRLMAEALAWQLELTRPVGLPPALTHGWQLYEHDRLWPRQAHTPLFDFEATRAGAEWIDAIAARAKPLASERDERLVGHTDWSGKHVRFADRAISVVYDWDSLRVEREAVIVGNAAMTFTTNFDLPGVRLAPTPDEVRAFVDGYGAARPSPLTRRERERIAACATFVAAYTARCERCRHDGYDAAADPGSFTSALREHGLDYLTP